MRRKEKQKVERMMQEKEKENKKLLTEVNKIMKTSVLLLKLLYIKNGKHSYGFELLDVCIMGLQ